MSRCAGERMVVAREHHQRIGQQRLDHHSPARRRIGEEVEIVLVAGEPLDQRAAVVDLQRRLDAGMALRESAEQARREIPRRGA